MNDPSNQQINDKNKTKAGRRLKRYHRAQDRRRQARRDDSRFTGAVFSLAGIGAVLAIGLGVVALNNITAQGSGGDTSPETSLSNGLMEPWLGPVSKFELGALLIIILLGGVYFWRVRNR